MSKKAYTLSNCDTSKRILKSANINIDNFEIIDIKKDGYTAEELDKMKMMSGSYESLFSRRAQKYKAMGLKDKTLSESDYRKLILQDYTFLKRPVIIFDQDIFMGNSKKVVEALLEKCKVALI